MSYWVDTTEEEYKKLIEEINTIDKRYVEILRAEGIESNHSHIEYTPKQQIPVGPLPKYIPKKIPKIVEPPLMYGPPNRIKLNREDQISRTKRDLEVIATIISTEGETEDRLKQRAQLIIKLNKLRAAKRKKRKLNKAKRKAELSIQP